MPGAELLPQGSCTSWHAKRCEKNASRRAGHAAPVTKGVKLMRKRLTRRQFLAATAGTSAGLIAAPYVSGVHAAGSLTVGLWDHWVPGANDVALKIINEWGEKEKV